MVREQQRQGDLWMPLLCCNDRFCCKTVKVSVVANHERRHPILFDMFGYRLL